MWRIIRLGRHMETKKRELPQFFKRKLIYIECPTVGMRGPCWILHTRPNGHGYGQIGVNGKKWEAHRFCWNALRGAVPIGMTIDHLCSVKRCCNPDHLQVVTQRVNNLRSDGAAGVNARKTHCPRGHVLAGRNIYRRPDRPQWRDCLICRRASALQYQRAKN